MSLSLRSIPKSATVIREKTGTVIGEGRPNDGKAVTVRFLTAYVSDGYKSEYTAHQAYFLVVLVDGCKPWAKRYSGKNLSVAENMWADMVSVIA